MSKRPIDSDEDSKRYKWMSQREHVLQRPDMYVGATSVTAMSGYVVHPGGARRYSCQASPLLLKLLDEALVNAIDNQWKHSDQKHIRITVSKEEGSICIENDGSTIPVEKFEGTEEWLPTVVFSEFMSGSNFNDEEQRCTGGRNGVGIKATNVWSTWFSVHVVNPVQKLSFEQTFESNMSVVHPPKVKKTPAKKAATKVQYKPDLERMGMQRICDDVMEMLLSRAQDASICTRADVSVHFNGSRLPTNTVHAYAQHFAKGSVAKDSVVVDGRAVWSIAVGCKKDDIEGGCIHAFVNGIRCSQGSHVNWAIGKVCDVIAAKVKAKRKSDSVLRPAAVRDHLVMVLVASLPNPRFTSQTKECLDLPVKQFGDDVKAWECSDAFRSALAKSDLVDVICSELQKQEDKQVARTASSVRRAFHIEKYEPATKAGAKGADCTLIVTEGDSAKALAMAGISELDRGLFGVFPLRGKLLNVQKVTLKKALENKEIQALTSILSLDHGHEYTPQSPLRYRHIALFVDMDKDGSHIGGLVINWLKTSHPSLLRSFPDFVLRFATPILRARNLTRGTSHDFFTEHAFKEWRGRDAAEDQLAIKYYKGLGTSTNKDARAYFSRWDDHVITFKYGEDTSDEAVDLFFSETKVEARKQFLLGEYDAGAFVDYGDAETSIERFLYDDMSHFSAADNRRSIPSLVDGMKPSQRKALYCFFRRNFVKTAQNNGVKVSIAAAAVSQDTEYRHGEEAMVQTIVGMAQDHEYTKNIALFVPDGQFGSRLDPPSKHAQARYIFTHLDPITRSIFSKLDDETLEREEDDGVLVEPVHFYPVIPMCLVNGASGIGTGWSTFVPCHNPKDVALCIRSLLDGTDMPPLHPWYTHVSSPIQEDGEKAGSYISSGVMVEEDADTLRITDLPFSKWTVPFLDGVRETLVHRDDSPSQDRFVLDVTACNTPYRVDVLLRCVPGRLAELGVEKVRSLLKLDVKIHTSNMYLHDATGKLTRYEDAHSIVRAFLPCRLSQYERRRQHLISKLRSSLLRAENEIRWILSVNDGSVDLRTMTKASVLEWLSSNDYSPVDGEYAYLLNMSLVSCTLDHVDSLRRKIEGMKDDLSRLESTSPSEMWKEDLDRFEGAYSEYLLRKRADREGEKVEVAAAPSSARRGTGARGRSGRGRSIGRSAPGGRSRGRGASRGIRK